ncbi:Mob1p ASCRUDRAFT_73274 [Ascoidea rubescens DSM 1968]|uniref:Mob1/phocein n=1 Tax=Ascoidea rubescens DSM 1968 TaxID=1344418 RepID=A0A1D2VPC3_9ASCO|nr:hypothetical protein ASCRUDRAFT_73274 [Ascoidea rubescens DSM 1968]ODV63405.1 hypothetical protein ASCRUDRAFT_73274 [Ascoidea rubescens DSM 1968]
MASLFQNFRSNGNGSGMRTVRGFKRINQNQQQSNYNSGSNTANNTGNNPANNNNAYATTKQVNKNATSSQALNSNIPNNTNGSAITSHKDIRNFAEATLGSGSVLAQAVKLPKDEDLNEWLAVHVVDFYNQINMLYSTITEFCSPRTCPRMIATNEYEYLWQDLNLKKPIPLPAPNYIENLMNWIQSFFDDDDIFPSNIINVSSNNSNNSSNNYNKNRNNSIDLTNSNSNIFVNKEFPQQFLALIKTIMKRLFRIYAHIYCHHFDEITELGLQNHLNTSLKHFVLFSNEFNLISKKDYGPLHELVNVMLQDNH